MCARQEAQWSRLLDTAAKKTLELGTIKMATLNLHTFVDQTKRPLAVRLEDTVKQLEQVGVPSCRPQGGLH